MAKRVTKNPAAERFHALKRRVSKMQRRAKCNGLIYMLATLALAALTGLALVVGEFWNPILALFEGDLMENLTANVSGVVGAALGCILALVIVINAIKTFTKLGWLFKKKASKVHGFNRNMYAMDDLGKIFTSTFASIVWIRFLQYMVGAYTIVNPDYIILAIGVVVHFFCGMVGGNVSVFSNENGVEEIKREIGNFVPFIRNLFQVVITAALVYFASAHAGAVTATVEGLVKDPAGALNDLTGIMLLVGTLFIIFMIGRSLNNVEFDPEGPEAGGRGAFVALSVFAFLVFAAIFAVPMFTADTLILAGISLAGIIIDALTVRYPREPEVNYDEVDSTTFFNQNYLDPGVYVMPNMVQHPIQQQYIQPYTAYGFELEYGMKKPAKLSKKR